MLTVDQEAGISVPVRSRGHLPQRAMELINWRIASTALVLVTLALVFHLTSGGFFFTPRNLSLLLRQASLVAILAAGVSMLMIMAEIDLSIGGAVLLTGAVAANLTTTYGLPMWLGVLAAIGCGVGLGAWNGFWVARFGVPSFVVTLGGLLGFAGIALMWTNAATVGPLPQSFVNLSEAYISQTASYILLIAFGFVLALATVRRRGDAATATVALRLLALLVLLGLSIWIVHGFLGLPTAIVWVIAVGAAVTFIATRTKLGRNAFMIGANREAAHLAGVNVRRHIFLGFILMGLLYGVGGVLLDARLAAWSPAAGQYLELNAIAAAVIGGTSLMGGIGTIPGAMVGSLLLATIDNGMSLNNVNSFLQQVVKGLILIFAVTLDQWAHRRQHRA